MTRKLFLSRSGMTLVELIVVIVIAAILAAYLISSLVGYIEKAKQNNFLLSARRAVMAAVTVGAEYGAAGKIQVGRNGLMNIYYSNSDPLSREMREKILELAELEDHTFLSNLDFDGSGKLVFMQVYTTASGSQGTVINSLVYSDFTAANGQAHEGYELLTWNKKAQTTLPFSAYDPARCGIKQPLP